MKWIILLVLSLCSFSAGGELRINAEHPSGVD